MTEFVLVPSGYDQVIEIILRMAPEFLQSPEYALLEGHGDDLPYVFMAEFAHYLKRAGSLDPALQVRCFVALEELARLDEYAVDELVEDTVFENLFADGAEDEALLGRFPPRLRTKADAWFDRTR